MEDYSNMDSVFRNRVETEATRVSRENGGFRSAIAQAANDTPNVYNELREIDDREKIEKQKQDRMRYDSIVSAIAFTPKDGSLSDAKVAYLNRARGIEPVAGEYQNGQIVEAGYNRKSGGYGFVVASKDNAGNVYFAPYEISRNSLYGMMKTHEGLFGAEAVKTLGEDIKSSDMSITDATLEDFASKHKGMLDARNAQFTNDVDTHRTMYGGSTGRGAYRGFMNPESTSGKGPTYDRERVESMKNDTNMRKLTIDAVCRELDDLRKIIVPNENVQKRIAKLEGFLDKVYFPEGMEDVTDDADPIEIARKAEASRGKESPQQTDNSRKKDASPSASKPNKNPSSGSRRPVIENKGAEAERTNKPASA